MWSAALEVLELLSVPGPTAAALLHPHQERGDLQAGNAMLRVELRRHAEAFLAAEKAPKTQLTLYGGMCKMQRNLGFFSHIGERDESLGQEKADAVEIILGCALLISVGSLLGFVGGQSSGRDCWPTGASARRSAEVEQQPGLATGVLARLDTKVGSVPVEVAWDGWCQE